MNDFDEKGYYTFPINIEKDKIKNCLFHLKKIKESCKKNKYKFFRVYDDYSNNINISGIESIFNPQIINQPLIDLFEASDVVNIARKLLKSNEVILTLSRYHLTEKFSHLGQWHRDGDPGKLQSIQINIYLLDEEGFEIIPNSYLRENTSEENNTLKKSAYNNLKNSKNIKSFAGSVLAFHPSFLHRGKSLYERAHIHLRFKRKDDVKIDKSENLSFEYLNNLKISEDIKKIIVSSLNLMNKDLYQNNNSFKKKLLRKVRYFFHKFIFFLPYDSFFYKKLSVNPCLKLRKKFNII
tara:strand:- start:16312 stop:17196 length:885 start_codon:yes stop_codon:yes gene_type:complete